MTIIIDLFRKDLNYYRGIDELPIYNWFKINQTNDLTYLLKEKHEVNKRQLPVLERAFDKIYREYIDTFGVPEQLREILILKRDIRVLEIDIVLTGDFSLQTFIDIKRRELEQLLQKPKEEKVSINDVKAYVEKYMGFRINERECTVKDYYTYVEVLKREATKSTKKDGSE